jgi:FRG domain
MLPPGIGLPALAIGGIAMSEFDLNEFLRSVHSTPQKKTATFDKDAFKRALNAPLRERIPRWSAPGCSALFVYSGSLDLLRIARGIAASSTRPAQIVRLASDDLRPGDARLLLHPLLHGQVLVLVSSAPSAIPARLAEYWPQFCENPGGYTAAVTRDLVLSSHLKPDPPGAVIVLQSSHLDRPSHHLTEWPLTESEAAEFADLADQFDAPIASAGRLPSDSEPLRDNQHAYRVYRELVNTIIGAGHERAIAESILRRAIRGTRATELEPDFLYHGIERVLYDQLFDQLRLLANHCKGISGGFRESEALPDVYAAALVVCANWHATSRDRPVVYRGQRNREWPVVPSFFRSNRDGSPPDLAARERRLATFVHLMRKARPELDERQCVAVAQHVWAEANTPTWLIDVTSDPLVALYFASSRGRSGDIGVVDQIVMVDWEKYVASRPDYPGGVILCSVPGIERLRRQSGLFLNAPRADLYQRYFPNRLWFDQHDGLAFTDALAESPVTTDFLLPPERDLEKMIARLDRARIKPKPLADRPPDPTSRLTAAHLLNTVSQREGVDELDPYHRTVLDVICELYTSPEKWAAGDNTAKFSLHRLDEVILRLVQFQRSGRRCHFETALEWSKTRLTDEEFGNLLDLGHLLWMQRYRIPPPVVAEEIARLIGDIGGLAPTLGGVTVPGPNDHVDTIVRALAVDRRWRLHDLRSSSEEQAVSTLPDLVAGGAVLIAAAPDLAPGPLRSLAEALADRHSVVRQGGRPIPIKPDSIVIAIFGAGTPLHAIEAAPLLTFALNIDEFSPPRSGTW